MRTLSILFALTALFLIQSGSVRAQSLAAFRERLTQPATDTLSGRTATVTIHEEESAAEVLRQSQAQNKRLRFKGWRVCIFSDNTADARSRTFAAIKTFEENFPDIPLYNGYESPYFRVSVGNCTTSEEAIILLERVRHLFPKAFVKQEQLSLADLLK